MPAETVHLVKIGGFSPLNPRNVSMKRARALLQQEYTFRLMFDFPCKLCSSLGGLQTTSLILFSWISFNYKGGQLEAVLPTVEVLCWNRIRNSDLGEASLSGQGTNFL